MSDEISSSQWKRFRQHAVWQDGINRTAQSPSRPVFTAFLGAAWAGEHWWQYPAASKQGRLLLSQLAAVLKDISRRHTRGNQAPRRRAQP